MATPSINPSLIFADDPGVDSNGIGSEATGKAEATYVTNQFNPQLDPCNQHVGEEDSGDAWVGITTNDANLTYTPARKLKQVHNSYNPAPNNRIAFCYVDDWSQYDERYALGCTNVGGRGADYMWQENSSYSKLVIGFANMIGYSYDPKFAQTAQAAYWLRIIADEDDAANTENQGKLTFLDVEGDFTNYRNCGYTTWVGPGGEPDDYSAFYDENTAQGAIGALNLIKTNKTDKTIAFSLGGWTMSYPFSELCADVTQRGKLITSIQDLQTRFSMFTHIDLDWEYPGSEGEGIPNTEQDGNNFATLIEEIHAAIPSLGMSIAVSTNTETLIASKIKENAQRLMACNVHINLMSYDMFPLGVTGNLGHHTNLLPPGGGTSQFSTDEAVQYLLSECGFPSASIFLGFAGYSRNARNATITGVSPLTGTYDTEGRSTVGSFEYGVTELPDLLTNYLDLDGMIAADSSDAGSFEANEAQFATTGFVLCTDEVANADYLHNPNSGLYLSIETPRTVKAKAEYVVANQLGGLFIWTGDQDNGILANAAWEGLGATVSTQNINMARYYEIKGVTTLEAYNEIAGFSAPPEPGLTEPREPAYAP